MHQDECVTRTGRLPLLGVAFDLMFWALLAGVLLVIVPMHQGIAVDFGVELSPFSRFVFDLSDWVGGRRAGQTIPAIAWLAPLVVLLSLGIPFLFKSVKTRILGWLLLVLWGLLPLIGIAVIVLGSYVPLIEMIESLQGASP